MLKHRRRKEKALRKLEAMQVNLTRLVDLTAELRRRLKPLGRQAAIARRAAVIQADLRDARLRLLADDYVDRGRRAGARTRPTRRPRWPAGPSWSAPWPRPGSARPTLDGDEQQHAPRLAAAQEAWFALSALAERLRGVASLAQERHAHLAAQPDAARPGRDPDELELEAESLREQEAVLGERLETAREQLAAATAAARARPRPRWPRRNGGSPTAPAAEARGPSELARLRAQVEAARSKASRPPPRRPAGWPTRSSRPGPGPTQAQREYEELQDACAGRDDDRTGLAGEHEQAAAALSAASARVSELRAAERETSAERAALTGPGAGAARGRARAAHRQGRVGGAARLTRAGSAACSARWPRW